jgi:hypothetical protein
MFEMNIDFVYTPYMYLNILFVFLATESTIPLNVRGMWMGSYWQALLAHLSWKFE